MFEKLKAWWLAIFLKNSIRPDNRPAKRYPEYKPDVDLPVHRDHYWDRTSDPSFVEIDTKVKEAIANLKAKPKGKF